MAKDKDKKKINPLLDPGQVLIGRPLLKSARAAANIEYKPTIGSLRQQLRQIAKDRRRDDRALAKLGRTNIRQTNRGYHQLGNSLGRAIGAEAQTGRQLIKATNQNQTAAESRLNELQGSALGGQLDSLGAAGIQPGGSASQAALTAAMAQQQAAMGSLGTAFGDSAQTMAAGMKATARNQLAANGMARMKAVSGLRSAVASRRMDSRDAYRDQADQSRQALRDAKSLRGAAVLENLMKLRDSERSFVNERAALMLDARTQAQKNALDWYKAKNDDGSGGSGGGSGGDGENDGYQWKQWLHAANQVRNGDPIEKGYWNNFLDQVEEEKDFIDWTPAQRDRFLKQYKQWYKNHPGRH